MMYERIKSTLRWAGEVGGAIAIAAFLAGLGVLPRCNDFTRAETQREVDLRQDLERTTIKEQLREISSELKDHGQKLSEIRGLLENSIAPRSNDPR